MRERAELFEPGGRRAAHELVDDPPSDATPPRLAGDHHRPHFSDGVTERSQFGACEDLVFLHGDDEAVRVHQNFVQFARQEMALGEVLVDQFVNGVSIMC